VDPTEQRTTRHQRGGRRQGCSGTRVRPRRDHRTSPN